MFLLEVLGGRSGLFTVFDTLPYTRLVQENFGLQRRRTQGTVEFDPTVPTLLDPLENIVAVRGQTRSN